MVSWWKLSSWSLSLLLSASAALAGGHWEAGARNGNDLASNSCPLVSVLAGNDYAYFRRCGSSATSGFTLDSLSYSLSNPGSVTAQVRFRAPAGTSDSLCLQVSCGCDSSKWFLTTLYGTPLKASVSEGTVQDALVTRTLGSTLVCKAAEAGRRCRVKVERVIGDGTCTDNYSGDLDIDSVVLSW